MYWRWQSCGWNIHSCNLMWLKTLVLMVIKCQLVTHRDVERTDRYEWTSYLAGTSAAWHGWSKRQPLLENLTSFSKWWDCPASYLTSRIFGLYLSPDFVRIIKYKNDTMGWTCSTLNMRNVDNNGLYILPPYIIANLVINQVHCLFFFYLLMVCCMKLSVSKAVKRLCRIC